MKLIYGFIYDTIANYIGNEGAIALAEMLKHNTCLASFDLRSTMNFCYIIIIFTSKRTDNAEQKKPQKFYIPKYKSPQS